MIGSGEKNGVAIALNRKLDGIEIGKIRRFPFFFDCAFASLTSLTIRFRRFNFHFAYDSAYVAYVASANQA